MALEAVQAQAGYVLLPSDHYVGGGDGAHDGDMPSLDVAEDGTARLVWRTQGVVKVTYNDPHYLADRHGVTGQDELLDDIEAALRQLATGA
ncbi:MAG: hypothetical protein H0V02_00920 [Nocardioidaceae bacterium]|nr:hypothetical protein [Nocardioidaceae bacterium]